MQVTGLADLIAVNLNFALNGMPLYFALVVIFVSTVILTQFISNAASVALILPVLLNFQMFYYVKLKKTKCLIA